MKISQIFKDYKGEDVDIKGLSVNSKTVKEGDLFICIKGVKVDRHDFIDEAVRNGAAALVTARDVKTCVPYIKVDDPNVVLRDIYAAFYDHPEKKLVMIGVTGTDGKTTTTSMIQELLGDDACGYIGTNGYSCKAVKGETDNTTPGIESLYRILDEFVRAGCRYVAMEASSEAFFYKRLEGIRFDTATVTNVDQEHLNTHKTLENYIDCKKQLFRQSKVSVLNSNDKHFEEFKDINDKTLTYGYKENDDLWIKDYEISPSKTDITYVYKEKEYDVRSPLLGQFNIENLAAALLTCLALGKSMEELLVNIGKLSIDGRMSSIDLGQDFYVLVDYAHTPNGLRRLFSFTNKLDVNRKIVVTGNAGERDASKRKYVGKLCVENNDHVIFTYE
ncbi:MAG: UDP-N-acetylmuramyl-tripeptide synthetase, partial [Erysipelotrichaceae bacterium]|nr:UDP-N-acetylmuramyl-tripeptide synthetase [Erysipelotrichaceae bacterium]